MGAVVRAAIGCAAVLLVAAPAQASIVYVKKGDVYLRSEAGKTKLVKRGNYFGPSLADNGSILAGSGAQKFVRMDKRGKITAGPFKTFGKGSSIKSGDASSPLRPVVSPNGKYLAYTWFDCVTRVYTWSISPCQANPSTYSFVSYAKKRTDDPYAIDSSAGYDPEWVGNGTVLHAGKQSISFDVIGDRTGSRPGGRPGEDREPIWMRLVDAGLNDILSEPAITRRGDKLAYVVSRQDGTYEIQILAIQGAPPAEFASSDGCVLTGPAANSLSWAPNGRSLAFATKKGVYTVAVGTALPECTSLNPKLVVRGGLQPHWGKG